MKTILVVEGHDDSRDLLVIVLTRAGFSVCPVANLFQARQALAQSSIDLILLDGGLKPDSGFDFCREIRLKDQKIPIVFYTCHGAASHHAAALEAGANAHLLKPLAPDEVMAALRTFLADAA